MKKILIIVGPTASGKSALAIKLAKRLKGEIISADSRQVYCGLNIGTGKVTKKEMQGVPHKLLSVVDPKKQFSAADWKNMAEQELQKILGKNKLPIVVGGTGFYIDALVGSTSLPNVPPNAKLRKKLEKLSADKLFALLKKRDPRRAKNIDRYNKVRLIRALEIVEQIGRVPELTSPPNPLSLRLGEGARGRGRVIWIGLKPKDLEKRIHQRLLKRLSGMIKEARQLHRDSLSWKRMYELGLEYRFLSEFLQNKIDKAVMLEKLEIAIRQYAKRQMTWFKRNRAINWFDSPARAYAYAIRKLEGSKKLKR